MENKNWHAQGQLAALWHSQVGTEEPGRRRDKDPAVDPSLPDLVIFSKLNLSLSLFLHVCKRVTNSSCSPVLLRSSENNKDLQRKPEKCLESSRYNHHRNVFYQVFYATAALHPLLRGPKRWYVMVCYRLAVFQPWSTYHGLWCFIRCHDLKGAVEM